MMDVVRRMVVSVNVPVTVDIESGYGNTREAEQDTDRAALDVGAVGVNLEDTPTGQPGELRDVAGQTEMVSAVWALAEHVGIDLYLNARTDWFWLKLGEPDTRLEAALRCARIYRDAGASGVFVLGVTDAKTIATLLSGTGCPLNVLAGPEGSERH
jgi:2-methylisocitrate lyase-like PEP mutase family enzyme